VSLCFRVAWLGVLVFAFFEQSKVNRTIPAEFNRTLKFGGRYVFLTHLNQLCSKAAFLALILSSFNILSEKSSSVFWSSTSLPLSFIVTVLYWSLYTIDPNLVRKKEVVEFIPSHLEFVLHTAITPATIIEAVLGGHSIAVTRNLKYVFLTVTCYIMWLLVCFMVTGDWPYGFVAKLGVFPSLLILVPAYLAVAVAGMTLSKYAAHAFLPARQPTNRIKTD
jgi:hypothetical protein